MAPIAGRETQLAELAAVVGLHGASDASAPSHTTPREPSPPLVVVYGGVSTGKSLCVRHALRAAADHFALVDCTGVLTTRAFYREVLGQLHNNSRGKRPRRSATSAGASAVVLDDDGDVTIMDAPPVEEMETETTRRNPNGTQTNRTRRRRVDEECKGSDADDASESDADSDDSSEEEDGPREPLGKRTTRTNGIKNMTKKTEAESGDVPHGSLNFLSFVKALRRHMDAVLPLPLDDGIPTTTFMMGPKPTVFIALDHVETLLERGFGKLLTCLLAVNDQLDYLHIFDVDGAPWRLCVVLIGRAVSLHLDLFLHGAHPAFLHFPPYTQDQVAVIVAHNLLGAADLSIVLDDNRERSAWLQKWLVCLYDLLPHCHNDWLEFQHVVVQMLPSFQAFFDLVTSDHDHAVLPQLGGLSSSSSSETTEKEGTNRSWVQLQKVSRERITALEKSRRRHLFGYDNVAAGGSLTMTTTTTTTTTTASASDTTPALQFVPVSSGDPVAFIASSKLSRSCLLLLLACYLASFTPHEADAHFVSSSGGLKRKRRIHKVTGGANGTPSDAAVNGKKKSAAAARKAMNQQLIGPKIFELPRLLAIYLSLQIESDALLNDAKTTSETDATISSSAHGERTRADIFTHLSLLIRLRLLQRASAPSELDLPRFRCIADTRLVHEIARRLQFPLDSYLNTRG